MMDMHQRARRLARSGLAVFPLHSIDPDTGSCTCGGQCHSPGKHPVGSLAPHGVKDATHDLQQIAQWWGVWPDANIAIATGQISDIVVVDVDNPSVWLNLQKDKEPLPPTWTVETGGGGFHVYFVYAPHIRNQVGVLPGIDTRSDNGYVVAPPSIHQSGQNYHWLKGQSPSSLDAPGCMPAWLEAMLGSDRDRPPRASTVTGTISEGGRNNTLASLAGTMRRRGMEQDEIEAALLVVNHNRCNPPLSEREVKKIAWSVGRLPPATAEIQVMTWRKDG